MDHVAVVLGQLVVQALGGMRQEVPVLVNRGAVEEPWLFGRKRALSGCHGPEDHPLEQPIEGGAQPRASRQ
ncbi:hypothetical protein, partial [Amaricoccus solimangrovi]|uniref:hypothetical protein n=1 Tax=Amaricoccus solimangrovi TaxID=2589815 RepID=UPI001AEE6FDF